MRVLVAGGAGRPQSQVGAVQVLNRRPFLRNDVSGSVATCAAQSGVFAFENVTGLAMIEGLGVPLDERKIFAVVLRVAARALFTRIRRDIVSGMQSVVCTEAGGDFGVAGQAF